MAGDKFERKMRFLPFFPYGFCSRVATTIVGKDNPYASRLLLGNDPEQTIKACKQYHENAVERAKYLCEKGYVKDIKRACGTPSISRSFRQLTKEGLATFTETPDYASRDEANTSASDGNKKDNHFRSSSLASTDLREQLCEYASSTDESDQEAFSELLLNSVIEGNVTPFTYGIDLVAGTRIGTTKYSQNQIYNIWRLSHVNAMFRCNNYLTNLDRRPYDTQFLIDGINSPESYQRYIQKHGNTPASLTYYALSKWYAENPGFYQVTQRCPDETPEARRAWLNTPAFYSTRELPNFDSHECTPAMGSQRKLNSIFIGLAMGKKINYLCYHGHSGQIKWVQKREMCAKQEMQRVIRYMKALNPEMANREAVDFALYFCSSHHQFLSLFTRTHERHKKGLRGNFLTDNPFVGMYVIPVNDSGACLLRFLLEYSPMEIEHRIHNKLVELDIGFEHRVDYYFPLFYKGKRVFSGYSMDISKINRALENHLDGHDFYICCFPDQAPWYRALFPGRTIL